MDAASRIEMFPEMGPPIPTVCVARPEFQEVFKPNFKIGKPKIDDFGEKASFGDALVSDLLNVGGAVLTGVTAGATAGAAGLSAAAGVLEFLVCHKLQQLVLEQVWVPSFHNKLSCLNLNRMQNKVVLVGITSSCLTKHLR